MIICYYKNRILLVLIMMNLSIARSKSLFIPALFSMRYKNTFKSHDNELSAVENSYKIILNAHPIIILRTTNSSIVGFTKRRSHTKHLEYIGGHNIYILLTGLSSDCHYITNLAREIAAKFVMDYSFYPSGRHLAASIARVACQKALMERSLACHLFVIDRTAADIFEVSSGGQLQEVTGGVAGCNMEFGISELEKLFCPHSTNSSVARELVTSVLLDMMRNNAATDGDERSDINSFYHTSISESNMTNSSFIEIVELFDKKCAEEVHTSSVLE